MKTIALPSSSNPGEKARGWNKTYSLLVLFLPLMWCIPHKQRKSDLPWIPHFLTATSFQSLCWPPWVKPDGIARDMSRKCWKGDLGLWQIVWSWFFSKISGGSGFAISQECLILCNSSRSLSGGVREACDIPGGHCLTKLAWDNFGLSSKHENRRERISLKAED